MIHISNKHGVTCAKMVTKPGKSGRTVYMYLVDNMLIDTGPAILQQELIPFYKGRSFDFVMLTHSHEDHTGNASWIQDKMELPIYIHSKGKKICEQAVFYPKYRQLTWGIRNPFLVNPVGSFIQTTNVDWKIIYTPGHSNDHVSLYDEESERLFTGDLFLTTEPKVIMKDESIPLMINSIKKLMQFNFKSIFCSHTGFIYDGRKKLNEKLSYLENLYGKVCLFYDEGYSVEGIVQKLFPKKYKLIEFSKGEYDTKHMVTSIINHKNNLSLRSISNEKIVK